MDEPLFGRKKPSNENSTINFKSDIRSDNSSVEAPGTPH